MLYIFMLYIWEKPLKLRVLTPLWLLLFGQSVMDANKHPSSHLLKQCSKC